MKLLLDAGNSRVKWACWEAGRLFAAGATDYDDGPEAAIDRALDAADARPAAVLVANVAGPGIAGRIERAVRARWSSAPHFATAERTAGGLTNGYDDPGQMGVDRWLAMVAAWRDGGPACCVVDAGTAVTCDLIASDGRHLGGYIVPGLALMPASLRRETGDIGALAGRRAGQPGIDTSPARDTETAMAAGALLAIVGLVGRSRAHLESVAGPARTIITGGHGPRVSAALGAPAEQRPLLVLEGLAERLA